MEVVIGVKVVESLAIAAVVMINQNLLEKLYWVLDSEHAEKNMVLEFQNFLKKWKEKSCSVDVVFHQAWVDVPIIDALAKKYGQGPLLCEGCDPICVFDVNSEEFGWTTDERMISGLVLPCGKGVTNSAIYSAQKHVVIKHNLSECDQRMLSRAQMN